MSDHYHARARLARVLSDVEAHLRRRGLWRAVKSVNEVLREYRDGLTRGAFDVLNGNDTARGLAADHRELIRSLAPEAFKEGLREGGIDYEAEGISEDEQKVLSEWIDSQISHVADFSKWIASKDEAGKINTEAKRRELRERIDLWVGAMENLGALGRVAADKNKMATWKYGETEHCQTCLKLNGKRKRVSWFLTRGYIPREVGSETLECGGYKCQCELVDDDGRRVL